MTEMIRIKRGDEWKGKDSVLYEIQEVRSGVGDDVPKRHGRCECFKYSSETETFG